MATGVSRPYQPGHAESEAMTMANSEKRPTAPGAQLRLCVPPDPRLGGYVRQEVLAFAETQGIADDEVIDFVSAIGEALANAIEHACTSEPIEISAWLLGEDRLFASVRDRGVGFAPTERTVSRTLPDAYAERGRGLPIMRRCSDIFSVRSAPGQGTRVTLGRYVHRSTGALAHHSAG
jgi:stage II sporulation protein AB (anti-sigma F factor)